MVAMVGKQTFFVRRRGHSSSLPSIDIYGVDAINMSDLLPASQSAGLGLRRNGEPTFENPVRTAVGSFDWLASLDGMTKPNGIILLRDAGELLGH